MDNVSSFSEGRATLEAIGVISACHIPCDCTILHIPQSHKQAFAEMLGSTGNRKREAQDVWVFFPE